MATVNTRIDSLTVDGQKMTAAFSSTNAQAKYEAKLDGWAQWKPATNPLTLTDLNPGGRTLWVRSFSKRGVPDSTPATRSFTVAATEPPPDPEPTGSAVVPGTGKLLRQDLMRGTAMESFELWGEGNPCFPPECLRQYATGGDTAPLIDGSKNGSYVEMLVHSDYRGCNDSEHRTRVLVGNNPANGNATMDNTFAAYRQGGGYATYFSAKIDPDPQSGWPTGNEGLSQIIEIMPPLASSHPPVLSLWERQDGTLVWSYRPTGGSSGRVDTTIPNRRGGWRRFCLTQITDFGSKGYHEFWVWNGKWERVFAKAGAVLVSGDPPSSEQLWGVYCESAIPGPRTLATANWQICEWRRP